jgi:hypothetical protein
MFVKNSCFSFFAKREWDKGGDGNDSNLGQCLVPVGLLDYIGLEGNFWTEFFEDVLKVSDGKTGSNFIAVDFNNGGGTAFIEHVANYAQ